VRGIVHRFIEGLATRFDRRLDRSVAFRDRLRYPKSKAERGVAGLLAIGILVSLGVLTAVVLTGTSGGTVYFPQSNADLASSFGLSTAQNEPAPRTVERHGTTVPRSRGKAARTARRGTSGERVVTLPGQTVREVQTVTAHQVVTDAQPVTVTAPPVTVTTPPETVTVVQTVKCKPKDC